MTRATRLNSRVGTTDADARYLRTVSGKGPGAVNLTPFDIGAVVGPVAGSAMYSTQVHGTQYDTMQGYVGFIPPNDCTDLQWVFTNAYQTGETAGCDYTIRAQFEYPEGTFTPVRFGGKRDGEVDGGAVLLSDPLAIDFKAGTLGFLRYRGTRIAGQSGGFPAGEIFGYISGGGSLPSTTKFNSRYNGLEQLITRTVTDGAMTASSATLTSATAAFVAQDAGQTITVTGAGASGATLTTTISAYVSATQVTLAASAATTVSGATVTVTPADKTGSGTIYNSQGQIFSFSPMALLGRTLTQSITVGLVGDSITFGQADGQYGGWAIRSLNPAAQTLSGAPQVIPKLPYVQVSQPGETVANLIKKHATRFSLLSRCTHILGMLGTNDIIATVAATTIEANFITLLQQERLRGAKPYYGTITPLADSTDGWTTLGNQTVRSNESIRIAFNTWLRDGAPIDSTTLAPVAAGTSGAIRANYYSATGALVTTGTGTHPAEGIFDLADSIESARNSGKWRVDLGALTGDGTHPNGAGNLQMAVTGAAIVALLTR